MTTEIASLKATISADTSSLTTGLKQAKTGLSDTEKAMMGARSTFNLFNKDIVIGGANLGNLQGALGAVGISFPTTPAALFTDVLKEGVQFVKESIGEYLDLAGAVGKISSEMSITSEEASRLIAISERVGISQDNLRAALDMAVKNGFAPSITSLAQLADQYVSIQDPVKRADLMVKTFGRNWTALIPLLKNGGDAIRDQAGAVNESLVLSAEQVQKAKELKIAQHELNEQVEALKVSLGSHLVPALIEVNKAMSGQGFQEFIGAMKQAAQSAAQDAGTFDGYAAAIKKTLEAQGFVVNVTEDHISVLKREGQGARDVTSQFGLLTKSEYDLKTATDKVKTGMEDGGTAVEDFYNQLFGLKDINKDVANQNSALATIEEREALAKEAQTWAAERQTRALQEVMAMQQNVEAATKSLAEAEANAGKSIGVDLASQLESAGVKGDKLYKALSGIDQILGTNTLTTQKQEDAMSKLVEQYAKTGDVDAFKDGVARLKEQFVPLNEEVIKAQQNVTNLTDQLNALNGKHVSAYIDIYTVDHGGAGGGGTNPGAGKNWKAPPPEQRQHGGRGEAGQEYLVGETGPELFTPGASGMFTPNDQLGGVNIDVTVNAAPGMDELAVAQLAVQLIAARMAAHGRSGAGRYAGR